MAAVLAVITAVAMLAGCARFVDGTPNKAGIRDAALPVVGDSHLHFDTEVKNAISDVMHFWRTAYPSVANGARFPELKGKLYSVDGAAVLRTHRAPPAVASEKCVQQRPVFVVDNAAYCRLDDSIIWDRSPKHLVPAIARSYGDAIVALVFAHEIGHAVQQRLGIDKNEKTIYLESQADCAAGAFLATALRGKAPHFRINSAELDKVVEGFLQIRDSTPESPSDISHGNGFDRVSAVGDGLAHGVTYCYARAYFNRTFTERPYVSANDYATGGNLPLNQFLKSGGPLSDLNRYWTQAAKTLKTTFQDVPVKTAAHPRCGSANPASEIGYCPDDNTVYYSDSFARQAYYSLTDRSVDRTTGDVRLVPKQPADFALGMMFAIAWGMAARHQFFHRSVDDQDGLLSAVCYSGAYARDINRAQGDKAHPFVLSPQDMDEATSAVLNLVGLNAGYSARGTTGVQRIQSFVTGYGHGLSACK